MDSQTRAKAGGRSGIGGDCVRELLGPYLDGELAESSAHDVAAHCQDCEPCRVALERLQGLGRLLQNHAPPAPPSGFAERLLTAARRLESPADYEVLPTPAAKESRRPHAGRSSPGGKAAIAVSLALGLLLGGWLAFDFRRPRFEPVDAARQDLGSYVPVFEAEYLSGELFGTLAEGYLTIDSVSETHEK